MTIFAGAETRVIVQGITGREGSFHTQEMLKYGTIIVGGVSPGKGGEWVYGRPVFDTVRAAVDATGADTTVIFVTPADAADAIFEAIDAEIRLIVCITQGIPVRDIITIHGFLAQSRTTLIGPNSSGLIIPERTKIGVMPGYIAMPGNVGVISRGDSLMYEVVYSLTRAGIGQTTCVDIGGDSIIGTPFVDVLSLFEQDPQTEKLVLIGDSNGRAEIEAAEFIKARLTKPVVAFIAGKNGAREKIEALQRAGVRIAENPERIPELLR